MRKVKFGLRTLLIVGTLVCVILATYGRQLHSLRRDYLRQNAAAAVIADHGGTVGWWERGTRVPWAGRYDQLINEIDLGGYDPRDESPKTTPLAAEVYDAISECSYVRRLILEARQLDLQGLAKAQRCQRLQSLELAYSAWSDGADVGETLSGFAAVEHLDLRGTLVTDEDTLKLLSLPHLKVLILSQCPVTEKLTFEGGVARLVRLKLQETKISDRTLARLLVQQPAIETLDLSYTEVSDESIPAISKMRSLTGLDLHRSMVSPEGVKRLKRNLPQCSIRYEPRYAFTAR